jgi:hypothetical protein
MADNLTWNGTKLYRQTPPSYERGRREQSMKPVTIMMVALALGACTPEQDLGQCKVEAFRLYPNDPPGHFKQPVDHHATGYLLTCMEAKGYEHADDTCPGVWLVPRCYKATGWRGWFSKK